VELMVDKNSKLIIKECPYYHD